VKKYFWYKNEDLLERIEKDPEKYPVLMTQAMCCIAINCSSVAAEITKYIFSPGLDENHKEWIERNLAAWLKRITEFKSDDSILILLGWHNKGKDNKGKDSDIKELLTNTSINDAGEISLMRQGTVPEWSSLMHYLRERFSNRVIFTPHPSQLQDGVLENYIKTEEGTNAIKLVKQLVIRGQA